MNANVILAVESLPLLLGFLLTLPVGGKIAQPVLNVWPSLASPRGRMTAGLVLICLSGLVISTHTYWIHEKITGTTTSFCASDSLFSCDDVIGHETYGYAPVIGLPWGLIGMGVFAALLYASMMVQKEPDAPGRTRMLQVLMLFSGGGVPVILLLISYEVQIEKLCQYCSMAHLANVLVLVTSVRMFRATQDDAWSRMARADLSPRVQGQSEEA
ncbi:MAG: vitamin K epoxide reductase family protein [Euryarchaeota archaeon TMED141]|nr:MAG: vitamin K epoxide reductase family protein [Euryarchaeota archaeon TMED141]HII18035.1 vitamin K epoxide reductase family protein [Candidatus Poseidoniaceae archaeon]